MSILGVDRVYVGFYVAIWNHVTFRTQSPWTWTQWPK